MDCGPPNNSIVVLVVVSFPAGKGGELVIGLTVLRRT